MQAPGSADLRTKNIDKVVTRDYNRNDNFSERNAIPMKKRFALALAAALCLTMLASTAYAADTTLDITYVPITEDGFVADTMDGVDAVYNRSGGPDCADLVARYYAAVYGVTVQLGSAPIVVSGEVSFNRIRKFFHTLFIELFESVGKCKRSVTKL